MDHQFKNRCINKIQYLISKFQLKLRFMTYTETTSMCKFDMFTLGQTKIKDILKYEVEFQNVLGEKTLVTHSNGFINIILPKDKQDILPLMNLLESDFFNNCPGTLKIALGENIDGAMIVGNLELWKHVLIAGETGGGKSISMHCFINSLIYNCEPSELQLILIDRNRVEFTLYENIKYLLRPVIYDLKEAERTLAWLVEEMKNRYQLFSKNKCRDIHSYKKKGNHLPFIVVFIDEFQTITLNSDFAVKNLIELFTQSRKAGIHLVVATQKPTTDVITPIIKANIPTRIAFSVGSHYDSQTILDSTGAEKLNKKGDMILKDDDGIERIQGAFISEEEIEKNASANIEILEFDYVEHDDLEIIYDSNKNKYLTYKTDEEAIEVIYTEDNQDDIENYELFYEVGINICKEQKASASYIRNISSVGYSKAMKLIKEFQDKNIIGEYIEKIKSYEVLISLEDFKNKYKGE